MKAITIWQPWASLIAVGAKRFETRSWPVNYRGPIAIHAAAKSVNSVIKEIFPLWGWSYAPDYNAKRSFEIAFNLALEASGMKMEELPTGCIVATAELVAVWNVEWRVYHVSEQERYFGNWEPGRYAWELANVKMLDIPIPAKGKQGLWDWEP